MLTVAGLFSVILIPVFAGKDFFIIPNDNFCFLSGCCFSLQSSPSTKEIFYFSSTALNNNNTIQKQIYLWWNSRVLLTAVLTWLNVFQQTHEFSILIIDKTTYFVV